MFTARLGVSALCLMILSAAQPVAAQDSRSVQDRLDRVERDLNQLQRQVYRNEVGGGPAPAASGDGAAPGSGALDIQIRMDQIEDQMRKLTGQLEEVQYGISQLGSRLDKMQSDNEVRFQQLENGQGGGAAGSDKTEAPVAAAAPAAPARVHGGAGNMDRAAPAAGSLAAPDADTGPAPQADAPATAAGPAGQLPEGTAQVQYNYAFGLLREHDFRNAETAFKTFLARHPTDPLAANAQYWLGDIYMERNDYKAASAAFADGYQKAPQGAKAPQELLKLGEALGNQGRKADACFSFARLERDFPSMAQSIRDEDGVAKKKFGC